MGRNYFRAYDPQTMTFGMARYLRHIAVQCIEIARECSDSSAAQKLESLSIELAHKAEQVEGEEQLLQKIDDQVPRD